MPKAIRKPRDLTKRQFRARLRAYGFDRAIMGGCWYAHPDFPGHLFGAVYRRDPFRIDRRATLSHLVRHLDLEWEKAR